jgi:protein-tyrosine phosphatase
MKEIQSVLNQNGIDLQLYLGNEIYMDDDIYDLLKKGEIYSLNGTEYLLIELPMDGEYNGYEEVFRDLISRGCKIILAHPERYLSFQKDFNRVYELEKMGVFFQSNLDSIIGRYGDGAKVTIKRLLKEKKIAFLATDIHHKKHDYASWDTAKKEILKYISIEEFNTLVNKNPSKLIC